MWALVATWLVACSGAEIRQTEPTGQVIATTGDAETSEEIETTPSTRSTTAKEDPTTSAHSDQGGFANPLPVGDPAASGFTYSDFGTEWEGFVYGLVETGIGEFSDDTGRCVVLVGTLTPTSIDEGAVSNPYSTPTVSLIANGALVDSEVFVCDTSDVQATGFGWVLDAEVTVGTTYPFYVEFLLPGDPPPEIEVIVVGQASTEQSLYYQPTVLDTIPDPGNADS